LDIEKDIESRCAMRSYLKLLDSVEVFFPDGAVELNA
jgi:hypothetical protein